MEPPTVRKTFKYKLQPTAEQEQEQERELERVVMRCRRLSNTALEQRVTAWQRCHVSLTRFPTKSRAEDHPGGVP
jgi:putative transposase